MLNDDYEIDEQWQKIRRLATENDPFYKTMLEEDIYKFIGKKKNIEAGIRARNKLNEMRKLCESLRKSMLKQRQDNESEY